jgi:hypothetical protein
VKRRRGGILAGLAPPLTSHGADLQWVLARAFGPPTTPVSLPTDPARAVALALRLGLGARLAARTPGLEAELGPAAARRAIFVRLQTSAMSRELRVAMDRVTELADRRSIPLVWLKFAALQARGLLADGSREARDVDVLVPVPRIGELHAALVEAGLRALPSEAAHHLPPLRLENGAVVELHTRLWGVEPLHRTRAGASYDDLVACGGIEPLSGGARVPQSWLLAAHALVHGLVQHRGTPRDYAPLRALCDVIDLQIWELSRESIRQAIERHLSNDELEGMTGLARALACGTSYTALDEAPAALLSGLVAASLDHRYQRALGLEHALDLVRSGEMGGALFRAFFAGTGGAGPEDDADRRHSAGGTRALQRLIELTQAAAAYVELRRARSR